MVGLQSLSQAIPEACGQDGLRQEERGILQALPSKPVVGESAAGNQIVDVRMIFELTSPGVEHAQEPERGAQMFWIGGDVVERAGALAEEQRVEDKLLTADNAAQFLRDGEGDQEVGNGE